jgi:hypothetical protein
MENLQMSFPEKFANNTGFCIHFNNRQQEFNDALDSNSNVLGVFLNFTIPILTLQVATTQNVLKNASTKKKQIRKPKTTNALAVGNFLTPRKSYCIAFLQMSSAEFYHFFGQ